jgi:GT2 family glycosyltransferase
LLDHRTLESSAPVERPLCSICIANYNGIDVVGPCLESVLSQDFDHPVEIIVHDDASTDGSVAFLRRHYPYIKLLTSEANVGFCLSNNRMVSVARGQFVLLLNNDATLFPNALRTLYDYALQQPKLGILGLPQYDMQTGELIDMGSRLDVFLTPIPNRDVNRRQVGMVTGACFWIPKTLWDELGGFPEFFGSLAEDLYLCCMARLQGYPVEALPESGYLHCVGRNLGGGRIVNNSLRTTYRRRALTERNKFFVMISCYPFPPVLMLLASHLALFVLEGLAISLLRMELRPWRDVYSLCLRQVLRSIRTAYAQRQKVRAEPACMRRFLLGLSPVPHKLLLVLRHGLPDLI